MLDFIAGVSMELWYYGDLNLTLAYTWYPEQYPVGGWDNTKFPLVDPEGSAPGISTAKFRVSTWLSFLTSFMNANPLFSTSSLPDAVIFNFGLHFTQQIDPPIY